MPRPTGTCALCRKIRLLAESHFLPKAHYKILRDEPNGKSSFVGAQESIDTTRQVKKHLLCDECEGRFNARGENWVQAHSLTAHGTFFIRDALKRANELGWVETDSKNGIERTSTYSGGGTPGIEIEKLTYFAASVFWRAAVTDWNVCGRTYHRLQLGPYEAMLRDFLIDEASFPEPSTLVVCVASEEKPLPGACFPVGLRLEGRYFKYNFHIPGLGFILALGKRIPEALQALCAVHSPSRIVVLTDMVDRALGDFFRSLLSTQSRSHATPKKK
jgi:hypothetical protein